MSQISFAHRLTLNNKVIRNDHLKKLQITEKVNEISSNISICIPMNPMVVICFIFVFIFDFFCFV